MATHYSPRSVTDGLVLSLDAGNNKSHARNRFLAYGSGTVTENVSFAIQGNGTFQRVAAGTVVGGYTIKTEDVVYSYALGSNGCHYHGNSVQVPSGVYVTFSCDYLVTGATNYPVNSALLVLENYGGNALGGQVNVANSIQDVWQRASMTVGPTAGIGTQAMFLYPGLCGTRLADSGTLYMRNPLVEWKNTDSGNTGYNSSTNLGIWYDMSRNGYNGTFSGVPVYNSSNNGHLAFDGVDDYIDLGSTIPAGAFSTSQAVSIFTYAKISSVVSKNTLISFNAERSFFLPGNRLTTTYQLYWDSVAGWKNGTNSSWTVDQWYYLGWTISGTTLTFYVNGVANGTATVSAFTPTASTPVRIGFANAGEYAAGSIASVSVYNRALTTTEILQNFNALRGRFGLT